MSAQINASGKTKMSMYDFFWEVTFVFESHIFRDLISTIIMPCYSIRTMSAANPFHFFYFKIKSECAVLKTPSAQTH